MFSCSANECSSATDFCFSSAISTDRTPDEDARSADRRARRVWCGGFGCVWVSVYVTGSAGEPMHRSWSGEERQLPEALYTRCARGERQGTAPPLGAPAEPARPGP